MCEETRKLMSAMLMVAGVALSCIADFETGLDAYARGDFAAARAALEPAAKAGDARAQFGMGILYQLGEGVAKDPVAAYRWFLRSSKQDHKPADRKLRELEKILTPEQLKAAKGTPSAPERPSPSPSPSRGSAIPQVDVGNPPLTRDVTPPPITDADRTHAVPLVPSDPIITSMLDGTITPIIPIPQSKLTKKEIDGRNVYFHEGVPVNGMLTTYSPGKVACKEMFKAGMANGPAIYFKTARDEPSADAMKIIDNIAQVVNYAEHGAQTQLNANGSPKSVAYYDMGAATGATASFDDEGKLTHTGYRIDGNADGVARRFNGRSLVEEYTYAAGKKHGPWRSFLQGGVTIGTYQDNMKEGPQVSYDPDGRIKSLAHFHQDKLDGLIRHYTHDGTVGEECQMHNGKRNGLFRAFHKGLLSRETEYVDDTKHGVEKEYAFRNGKSLLLTECTYVDGFKDGREREYDPDTGEVVREMHYKQGSQNGTSTTYYANGNIDTILTWENGKLKGPYKYYQENGDLFEEGVK